MEDKDWAYHLLELHHLPIVEDKALEQVSQIMQAYHGLFERCSLTNVRIKTNPENGYRRWKYEDQSRKWGSRKSHGGSKA